METKYIIPPSALDKAVCPIYRAQYARTDVILPQDLPATPDTLDTYRAGSTEYGTAAHLMIRHLLAGQIAYRLHVADCHTADLVPAETRRQIQEMLNGTAEGRAVQESLQRMAQWTYEYMLQNNVSNYAIEQPVVTEISHDIICNGRADLVLYTDDGFTVIDYKTGANWTNSNPFGSKYPSQLAAYALGIANERIRQADDAADQGLIERHALIDRITMIVLHRTGYSSNIHAERWTTCQGELAGWAETVRQKLLMTRTPQPGRDCDRLCQQRSNCPEWLDDVKNGMNVRDENSVLDAMIRYGRVVDSIKKQAVRRYESGQDLGEYTVRENRNGVKRIVDK